MFVEHKEAMEVTEAPVKTMKLSEAIRKGKQIVGDEQIDFSLCAIGCAWAGVHGHILNDDDRRRLGEQFPGLGGSDKYARALGFPRDLCREVSLKHCSGWPALKIADWLEAKGF